MQEPHESPEWLSEDDLDVFVRQFDDLGFTAALDWYRNLDRNWELTAPFEGAALRMPALYLAGDRDPWRSPTRARRSAHSVACIPASASR